MDLKLPAKCFISHSYKDAEIRDRILRQLPAGTQPIIFPPIVAKPEEFVSNHLMESILNCDGLIYLRGGKSEQSFWVAFERDYALRAGKEVFAADPITLEIVRDTSAPLDLPVFASYHRQDFPRLQTIMEFLARERYFDLWLGSDDLKPGEGVQDFIANGMTDRLNRGGYAIIFWSWKASESRWIQYEIELAAKGVARFNDRVLFALLDDCPIPEFWLQYTDPAVPLYAVAERSTAHRLDDLVVRLYWLIYRKTKDAN